MGLGLGGLEGSLVCQGQIGAAGCRPGDPGTDRKYRPPTRETGRFWRRCKGDRGAVWGREAEKVQALEDEVFQTRV